MRNISSYVDISQCVVFFDMSIYDLIMHNMVLYVIMWVYDSQHGFIYWHMLHIVQNDSTCHHTVYDSVWNHTVRYESYADT